MQSTQTDLSAFMARLEAVAREAGDIAMAYFRPAERTSADVNYKSGGSPVTEADLAVDRFLFEQMASLAPGAGWLSEETADTAERLSRGEVIVVDPIDGTTAFVRGDKRWAVSIALIEQGCPVVGVVHAPALGKTFAARKGGGAFLNGEAIGVSPREELAGARIVSPRDKTEFFEKSAYGFKIALRAPSLALRLTDVAAGANDLAIASPGARDWDIAAADVILSEAGGLLSEIEGGPLTYNRASSRREMLVAAPRALFNESLALAKAAMKGKP
jgi:myo-inositol-1(or 4)-monophosphatase